MILFYAPHFLFVLSLLLLALLFAVRSYLIRRICVVGMVLSIPFGLALLCLWGWLLKDGLGPGAEESHGFTAWSGFFQDTWWGILLFVVVGITAYFANRRAVRRSGSPPA
jgi:hypothetical protein